MLLEKFTSTDLEDKHKSIELEASEQATYPWHQFKPSCFCGCFNFVLQLVLVGSLGSFLFGFNIALLNTATKTINSSFLQCGGFNSPAYERFQNTPYDVCLTYKECRTNCVAMNQTTNCGVPLNSYYGTKTPAECAQDPVCLKHCAKYEDTKNKSLVTSVRCPGGYNDIECDSLKWYNSCLACSVLIGATIGALTGSRFLQFGRRTVLLVTMCIFLVGIVSSTVSHSFSALIWGRLIIGYAVGLVSVASPTYMSEVTPKQKRGTYGVFHQLMIVIGIFIPLLLGLPLKNPTEQNDLWVPEPFQEFWWRFMLALGIVPTLLTLYLLSRVFTFDTPVYYVEQRRFKDASRLLQLIHGREDIQEELDSIIDNVRQSEINKQKGMTFQHAFKNPEYRHVIIIGCLLSAFQQFGGINVFTTSSSEIFKKAGLNGTMQTTMSILLGGINLVMTFPTLYLIERMGRKSLMLMGSSLQFIVVVPAAIMYWINKDSQITQILAIVAVIGFVFFFAIAYGPVLWVYLFEIYPFEIKDVAAGVATAVNWISGVIMVFVSGILPNTISYTLFAALQLVGTLIIALFMKETRGLPLGDSPFITKKHQV